MIKQHADGIHCVYGDFRHKPRTKSRKEPGYPFWLNAKEDGEWEELKKHTKWIRQAFGAAQGLTLDPSDQANPEARAIVARVDRIAMDADPFG